MYTSAVISVSPGGATFSKISFACVFQRLGRCSLGFQSFPLHGGGDEIFHGSCIALGVHFRLSSERGQSLAPCLRRRKYTKATVGRNCSVWTFRLPLARRSMCIPRQRCLTTSCILVPMVCWFDFCAIHNSSMQGDVATTSSSSVPHCSDPIMIL